MNIKVQNLKFSYGTKKVLSISNTEFEQGKIYGIVGKNGVGKTTFFKALTNIITNYYGTVSIDGVDIKKNLKALSKVGIVLDDMELYKNQTGLFNIRYFGGLRGGVDEAQAMQFAQELEIADSINRKVNTYSLGMNKKLILLISIMNDAEVLIFDEPFRGLDAKSVNWFKDHLLNLKKQGRMILISSHVKEDIETLCDKVLVMENGDFRYTFDLNADEQQYIYHVEVNSKPTLMDMLRTNGISFEEQTKFIKLELSETKYKEVFKQAVAQDIEFLQIKRENKFVDLIK
ncbi:MAG: ABC transporter ATP-binding protein [Dysgonamonadaceae bacterium]|jgi:ABC-2 type transport system ATP-binding protein|nr:ABC transporter ATP-binding protein [Dysgonamonadaceae bacterium]